MSDGAEPAETAVAKRLHPVGLLVGFVTNLPQLAVPIIAAVFGTRGSSVAAPVIIAAVLLASLVFRWLGWLRFHYFIGEDDIRIERGLLSRSARSIPYDRIQDVSVEQKPLARLFGLGEVKFETGGGKGDEAALSFVTLAEAKRLREVVRARRSESGHTHEPVGTAEEAAVVPVFAMDNQRLLTLGFYSFSLVIFAVLAGAAQQLDFLLPDNFWDLGHWIGLAQQQGVDLAHIGRASQLWGALAGLIALVLIGLVTGMGRTVLTEYGFRLDRTARGFRRRRGLLTRTDVVMPVERIQAAAISTGPLRKRRGWYALQFVSLASESKKQSHHMVAPLARLDEIWPIIAEVGLHPPGEDLQFQRAAMGLWFDRLVVFGIPLIALLVVGAILRGGIIWPWLLLPVVLALPSWFSWRRRACATDAAQLYARQGWWNEQLDLARQVNVQSVSITQGPLARRRGLAQLEFGIAGGKLAFTAIPLASARAIAAQVLALAAQVDFSQLGRADLNPV